VDALRKAVLIAARDLMTGDIREGVSTFVSASTPRMKAE